MSRDAEKTAIELIEQNITSINNEMRLLHIEMRVLEAKLELLNEKEINFVTTLEQFKLIKQKIT